MAIQIQWIHNSQSVTQKTCKNMSLTSTDLDKILKPEKASIFSSWPAIVTYIFPN